MCVTKLGWTAILALITVSTLPATTVFDYVSEPGDFIGQGMSATYTDADGAWTVGRNFDNGVSFKFLGVAPGLVRSLDFAAPFDVSSIKGFYANAERWPFQAADRPGLSVFGEGRGCNTLSGEFSVLTDTFATNGDIIRFHAAFEQHCELAVPALLGTIEFVDEARAIFFEDFEDFEGGDFCPWIGVVGGGCPFL